MKKILSVLTAILTLASCIQENFTTPGSADVENIVLNFSIVVPEAQTATKSISAPEIGSLTVIAFDEHGYFVTAAAAQPVNGWSVTEETQFKVTLPQSAAARKLHMVANCPKPVADFAYGPETEIMTDLITTAGTDAYWQCVDVSNLLSQNKDALNAQLQKVPMIRNYAKISVGTVVKSFEMTGYAIVNVPTSGTVTPYNTSEGEFQAYVNQGAGLNYTALKTAGYNGFIPSEVEYAVNVTDELAGIDWVEGDELAEEGIGVYTYESPAENETALLVRGKYDNSSKETYYKVALYDAENGNYDILRNIEYVVNINKVAGPGYSTPMDAVKAVAGNNISASTATQNLLNISDGTQRLYVEYTAKRVVSTDPFTLKYKFLPTPTGDPLNTWAENGTPTSTAPITITHKVTSEDGTAVVTSKVVADDSTDSEDFSTITFTPQSDLPESGVWSEEITIRSTYNNVVLSRTVTLYMLNPYQMNVVCDPDRVADSAGSQVDLKINISSTLPSEIFPLVFDIEAEDMTIYPDATAVDILGRPISMPVVSGSTTIPESDVTSNTFHFQRTLSKEEYDAIVDEAGENSTNVDIPCYFLTNKEDSETTIHVSNEYFVPASDSFVNFEAKYFTNLSFPDGVKAIENNETRFTFNMSTVNPVNVTLTGLTTQARSTSFVYTPTATGLQTLTLYTVNASGPVKVELEADAYDYARASLSQEQMIQIIISQSANVSFNWSGWGSPSSVSKIAVAGGTVKSGWSATLGQSGSNRTVTFNNLVFEGANLTDESVVTITINGSYSSTQTISTRIGALRP